MNKLNFAFLSFFALILSHSAFAADVADVMQATKGEIKEAKGGLPQFEPDTFASQLFWLAITFMVMFFVFSKFTLPSISSVIENRKNIIDSDLDMAEKLSAEADSVHDAYNKSRYQESTINC